ncbi:MAG TPA: helix-turn-helix domain-containing protein [Caldimonas sp.]|nr:helix-turn-helix domain-containing protein [Caldimonas sp.]
MASCKVQCSHCNLREICLPVGLTRDELERMDGRLVAVRRRVAHGETLFRTGDRLDSVYAVWTGFFKTIVTSNQGREQVTGFQMGGEMLGLDGIDTGRHEVDATALEDSQVFQIPFAELEALGREVPSLQRQFHKIMSREIGRDSRAMLLLGTMYAEERVAAFLLDLTHRLQARGYSASSVLLRMSREEIGSFLGLKLETVSRTFSKFQASGLLFVQQKQIQITDPVGLQHLLDGVTSPVGGSSCSSTRQPGAAPPYKSSGTMSIAPQGHSATQTPQPLQ